MIISRHAFLDVDSGGLRVPMSGAVRSGWGWRVYLAIVCEGRPANRFLQTISGPAGAIGCAQDLQPLLSTERHRKPALAPRHNQATCVAPASFKTLFAVPGVPSLHHYQKAQGTTFCLSLRSPESHVAPAASSAGVPRRFFGRCRLRFALASHRGDELNISMYNVYIYIYIYVLSYGI